MLKIPASNASAKILSYNILPEEPLGDSLGKITYASGSAVLFANAAKASGKKAMLKIPASNASARILSYNILPEEPLGDSLGRINAKNPSERREREDFIV